MEEKVSAWVEIRNKLALWQAGFRPTHSIVDCSVTSRKNALLI